MNDFENGVKFSRRAATAGILLGPLVPTTLGLIASTGGAAAQAADVAAPAKAGGWREDYAYSLGIQAYIFGFPWIYLPTIRWSWVTVPKPPGSITPYAALSHFYNVQKLADASYRDGGAPNNDTLYSIAWIDVRKEPVILSHPEMGERYFTFELASLDSDNFAYVGLRTTGGKAGDFAIVGPGWTGTLPSNVQRLDASRTGTVLCIGRTLVDGTKDLPDVHKLQDQYRLTPLSLWGQSNAVVPEDRNVFKPFDASSDPLAEWKTMNMAMTQEPPQGGQLAIVKSFASIGVGPGQEIDAMDADTKRGLAGAAVDGRKMLNEIIKSGDLGTRINGWSIPPKDFGRAGLASDYLLRGSLQCLGGIIANDPPEAMYLNTAFDAKGDALAGSKRYLMRFQPGQLPDVKAFWSITMYDPTYNLVANPINRYSIGNRTPGLKADPDGGLTIQIQGTSPGPDQESNWLPSPTTGPFLMVLRTYIPSQAIIDRTWHPPGIEAVS
jgi:hypothetical protein